jgi:coproporphyrinogen III oxidase
LRRWERDSTDPNAGYGITTVLEGGRVLEKAAANVSVVRGVLSPERAAAMSSRGREVRFTIFSYANLNLQQS